MNKTGVLWDFFRGGLLSVPQFLQSAGAILRLEWNRLQTGICLQPSSDAI